MVTKEQVIAFLQTDEGKVLEKELITKYIQDNPEGKTLMDELMSPELTKVKENAVKEWETVGKGKNLREHNKKLMDEIQQLKEIAEEGKKLKNLLDISGFSNYNLLEEAVLSIKSGGTDNPKADDEVVNLKKELHSYRVKARELEARLPALEKERDGLKAAVQDSDSYISNLLINNQIKSSLLKQGFSEYQAEGLVSRIAQLGKFHIEKDEATSDRKAINDVGITPEEYTVKEYLATDEGKSFRPNKATGGGASGDGAIQPGRTKSFKDMNWSEKQALLVSDPKKYAEMKRAARK